MRIIIVLLFGIFFMFSLESIFAMGYKRFKAPDGWHCIDDYNKGIVTKVMEMRQKSPSYMPVSNHHKKVLKLFEDCVKSGEGWRFKKSYSDDYLNQYNDY